MGQYAEQAGQVMAEVQKVIIGKNACVEKVMAAILAGGHILLEDVPGVGKTEMALAFSKAMNLKQNRVQFTPDVLPADITGFSMYRKETNQFYYQPGAVMCNLLLADEINRTSPKTQSALLEVMEEGHVTVDGVTREVPTPFIVLATQNPVGSFGTQMLPESQMDRFMVCMSMGYPDIKNEIRLLKDRHLNDPLNSVVPVIHGGDLLKMQKQVENVFIHDLLYQYMVHICAATRAHPMLELGVSPRGTLALAKMSKAEAFLHNRDYVVPTDVERTAMEVLLHRMRPNSKAKISHISARGILEEILDRTEKPTPARERR